MPNIRFEEKTRWKLKADVMERFKKGTAAAVLEAAEVLAQIVRADWSSMSPSPEGGTPGIKTGNLDSSVMVSDEGHVKLRKIPNDYDVFVMYVLMNSSQGNDPQGRGNYGVALETSYHRQFVNPAILQVLPLFPISIKRRVSK